ncbi:MAG: alpha-L-fucosidase, partial [Acidimicrobiia bacterium]|nr:alpha-L-fucosidase [Acidimicrobiia bacterium]
GIGPNEHGAIPEEQAIPLRGLGDWLSRNGEAIYATRPWDRASTVTSDGTQVRFTTSDGVLYALILETPSNRTFTLVGIEAESVTEARLLGTGDELERTSRDRVLELTLPESAPEEDAYAVRLGTGVRWIS